MPLTLITGPANAGKAELVFEGVREDLARGGAPWLIVPRASDARHYRRELAGDGVALGVRVALFDDLSEEIARRAHVGGSVVDASARERVVAALLAHARERRLERGYAGELARLVGELERTHVTPSRLRKALAAWERSQPGVAAGVGVLGDVYARYERAMRDADLMDVDTRNARALDALREYPALWRAEGTPETAVYFYGFDDLTAFELDAIETLARLVEAPVTVALTFEPGRVAFADRAGSFQVLLPWASRHIEVPRAARHYAPTSRRALGHLERRLFEPEGAPPDAGDRARVDPGDAIRVLEGGGERAEMELVAAEIRALLDRGVLPREIALVHRTPEALATTLPEVLRAQCIPFSLRRRLELVQSALGRGLLALLRCALQEGDAHDLLSWLRTPGVVRRPELVDRLEVRVALSGARTAAQARALWEEERWPLDALDRLRGEAERGPATLVGCVERELWRLFYAPRRGEARELGEHERHEASACREASAALTSLRELIERLPQVPLLEEPAELVQLLEEVTFAAGGEPDEEGVAVLRPHELRARRVRALFLCGLQERVFPAPARAPAFLGEQERRGLAEASGLVLKAPHDWLARERYLLYSCLSRPEQLLVLSWHTADEDGEPTARSLFVDDVCDLFDDRLLEERRRRPLGAIDLPAIALAEAAASECAEACLGDQEVLGALGSEHVWSASALGTYAACPVRWYVEHLLRPEGLEPESEPLASGRLIHEVLAEVMEALRRERGSAQLERSLLERAQEIAAEAIERHCADSPLSLLPEQNAGLRRRLEADIDRFLEHAAEQESVLEPTHLELAFGLGEADAGAGGDARPALQALDLGDGVRVRGRIDRIDVGADSEAVVYDYKRRGGVSSPAGEKWVARRSLQVALYMHAARDLLGVRTVGGFYQPVTGEDLRARGALEEGVQAPAMKGDRYEPAELEALLDEVVALARESAALAASGALEPRPHTCSPSGQGCMYPTICRCAP